MLFSKVSLFVAFCAVLCHPPAPTVPLCRRFIPGVIPARARSDLSAGPVEGFICYPKRVYRWDNR